MINMIKDLRSETLTLAHKVGVKIFIQGDVFKEKEKEYMITIPLNYKNEVDDKFIRFINNNQDRVKVVVIVSDGVIPGNIKDIAVDNIEVVDLHDNLDKSAVRIINKIRG